MTAYDEHSIHFGHSKRHKFDIMDEYLSSIGYQRKPIPKDGSCLFRALSEQLFSTQAHHLYVRESCCRYMKRNQSTFENFIDGPFDEYLSKMNSPKEWGDQLEISALSKMYSCDFCIYEQPGQRAKNVTENDFKKKVYLCHSGQKHYDSVYPLPYFNHYGICQSIIYSLLFENVLCFNDLERQKSITTFRMLSAPSSDDDDETVFPPDFLYEPSIGILTPGVPPEHQLGLAYKFPVSIDFIRGLDPSLYRNVDYDFWITIKRAQQYIDFSIAGTMPYLIGDRCMVTLSIYSKPLVGHVQEVSPDFGPITVFIEDLGGKHTIPVRNAKPMSSYNNGCRLEAGRHKRKPFVDSNGWGGGGKGKRYSYRNRNFGMASMHLGDLNFDPKYLEFVASQQKKLRTSVAAAMTENNGRNGNNSGYKNKGKNSRKKGSFDSTSPPQNKVETVPAGNHDNGDWEAPGYHDGYGEGGHVRRTRTEESVITQIWKLNINSEETTMIENVGLSGEEATNNLSDINELTPGNGANNCPSQDSQESTSSETTILQNTIKEPDDNNNHETTSAPIAIVPDPNNYHHNGVYDGYNHPVNYGPSSYPSNPAPPQYYPQQSLPNPGYNPYSVLDSEGKDVTATEEKSSFNYFYNLGVEYYRQLSANGQRPVLVNPLYSQPNNNATMGFVTNNQHYINNQQPPQYLPHYHPCPPNEHYNPRLLVQIPPTPSTPMVQQYQQQQQQQQQQQYMEGNSPEAGVDNSATGGASPVYMLRPDLPASPLFDRAHRGYLPQHRFEGVRVYPQVFPHHPHHFRA